MLPGVLIDLPCMANIVARTVQARVLKVQTTCWVPGLLSPSKTSAHAPSRLTDRTAARYFGIYFWRNACHLSESIEWTEIQPTCRADLFGAAPSISDLSFRWEHPLLPRFYGEARNREPEK